MERPSHADSRYKNLMKGKKLKEQHSMRSAIKRENENILMDYLRKIRGGRYSPHDDKIVSECLSRVHERSEGKMVLSEREIIRIFHDVKRNQKKDARARTLYTFSQDVHTYTLHLSKNNKIPE